MKRLAQVWADSITALSLFIEGLLTRGSGARPTPHAHAVPEEGQAKARAEGQAFNERRSAGTSGQPTIRRAD